MNMEEMLAQAQKAAETIQKQMGDAQAKLDEIAQYNVYLVNERWKHALQAADPLDDIDVFNIYCIGSQSTAMACALSLYRRTAAAPVITRGARCSAGWTPLLHP